MSTITAHEPAALLDQREFSGSIHRGVWGRVGLLLVAIVRVAIGVSLCVHQITSVVVVGWTFRLMRQRILKGWWNQSPRRDEVSFPELAGLTPGSGTPRMVLAEHVAERLQRPGPRGKPPSRFRKLVRIPGVLLGGLVVNFKTGVLATACTYAVTGPACLIWAWSWEYGWNNSFHKGYEQSAVGPLLGLIGVAWFIAAMTYLPTAWAHMAATNDPRACFDFRLVRALVRQRPGFMACYAALFSLAVLPVSIMRAAPTFLANIDPAWESATAEQVRQFANRYILACGIYAFLAFVAVHLLAARFYRSSVRSLLRREPEWVDRLHPALARTLQALDLLPDAPLPRRPLLVAAVLGTGRRIQGILLRLAIYGLWFTVVAQIYIVQFFHYQWFQGWMNQPLVHLPSLFFLPSGPG